MQPIVSPSPPSSPAPGTADSRSMAKALLAEIEEAARVLGKKPRTVTRECGQGGILYDRLLARGRVWPETAQAVRDALARLLAEKAAADKAAEAEGAES